MAGFVFDPKLSAEAVEAITAFATGDAQAVLQESWDIIRQLGEDNPIVDGAKGQLLKVQEHFNDQFVVINNKVRENLLAYEDTAKMINTYAVAGPKDAGDFGSVQDNNYDAAKNL